MNNFNIIQTKLEQFIRKYYTNELIKGAILFFSIGLLYFIFTLLIEHFLWLNSSARTILFWLFITVEIALFAKFIALPIAKLFKLQKGIDYKKASTIIGNHFPEVNDKLLNVLQLKEENKASELLLASIDQKSEELSPIPFKRAVNFKQNTKYLKYAAIPVAIVLISIISGKFNWFSDSYKRVVNYQTAYEPPAPFQFFVLNDNLQTIENKEFRLMVSTQGEVIPEDAQITFNNETYYLQQREAGHFEYVFEQPKQDLTFNLYANGITSKPYTLKVVEVPTLLGFKMILNYPNYTNKRDEVLKGVGNAVVPQGTRVTWQLNTKSTDAVDLISKDTLAFTTDQFGVFEVSKNIYNNLDYNISTSNKNLKHYENLAYSISVIKDQYPELKIEAKTDSLDQQSLYFKGQVSDDYGLSKLQLVYYPNGNESEKKTQNIPISKSNFDEFISAFPNNLIIEEGVSYNLYFQVFDNDAVNKNKSTKSVVYNYRKRTQDEDEQKQLQEQNQTIQDLNKSLEKFDKQQKELQELSKTQKEKSELNFNDKKKFENFLKRQKQQEQMMKQFNKKLKDNLNEFQKENKEKDQFKEDLKERLKDNEEQLKKDEKLLEELEKLKDKFSKEEFSEKLDNLAKKAKSQKRSLEQLLELTKRYYVTKKMEKIGDELEKLAEEQNKLANSKDEENTKEKQDEINKKFEDIQKQLEELEKDNQELKSPMDVPRDKNNEENIKEEQQEASEKLQEKQDSQDQKEKQEKQQSAKQKQKSAAQKMKNMSMKMQMQMGASAQQQLSEDIEMLRQILDNLVVFSFDEESLMNQFKSIEINHNEYATYLKKQKELRTHFEHVDDSLFAISLRQPMFSENINREINEVYFNIDKSLEQLSENMLYQGVSSQQYALTSANNLADFLSGALDNMQMQMGMPSPGQGEGGMPLPDIIISQEELAKKMEDAMKKGEEGKKGKEGKEGEQEENEKGNKPGDKEGEQGKKGNKGKKGGENGEGQGGEQEGEDGYNEDINGELFKIYQEQQLLRQALEERLDKEGLGENGDAKQLLKDMEEVELDLINKGFTNETLSKMMNIQHQLLKLKNAVLQQGQEQKRQSETNKKEFKNTTINQVDKAKQYFNTTEILNKQTLPLQQIYKQKAQQYFKQKDD
ncbi:DUF4175 family protein [Olleya aquimaris]|uniref:DUF4175 family protein n=1 Tax=Olleya aquimaris TaxID=639310 RepID=A0A327RNK1_9FLAO|nr:DUF4175 family protein [Olleya aquimaris]RAJ17875.1 hypothetical protein LY08_00145 [Olleya aquimaris]